MRRMPAPRPMNLTLTRPAATLSHRVGEGLGACPELAEGLGALFQWKFMAPILVHMVCRWKLPMNLSCLVAADVRRLTLSWRVRRERDQSLVTSAATLDLGSRPQFACTSRCQLPMNLTFGNSKLLAFSPLTPTLSPLRGEGAVQGPNVRPKFRRSKLPMNLSCLVAADVRRLTLSGRVRRERDQSLVTSAATLDLGSWVQCASEIRRSRLPMNRPSGSSRRQEAHSTPTRSPGKRSEPRYLGCYVRLDWVHGSNVRPKFGGRSSP